MSMSMSAQPLPQLTTTPPADPPRRRFGSGSGAGSFSRAPAATSASASASSAPTHASAVASSSGSGSGSGSVPALGARSVSGPGSGIHRQRPSSTSIASHPSYPANANANANHVSASSSSSSPSLVPPPQPQRARSSSSASSVSASGTQNGPGSPAGGFDITFAADKAQQWLSTWAPRGEGRGREFLNNTLSNVASVASTVSQNLNREGFIASGGRSNSFVSSTTGTASASASASGVEYGASPSTSPEERVGVSMSPTPGSGSGNFNLQAPALGHAASTPLLSYGQPTRPMNGGRKIPQPANLARLGQPTSTSTLTSTPPTATATAASTSTATVQPQLQVQGGITNSSFGGSTTSLPSNLPRSSSSGSLTPTNTTTSLHGPSHLNPNAPSGPSMGHRRNSSTTSNVSASASPSATGGTGTGVPAHRRSSSFGLSTLALKPQTPPLLSLSVSRSSSRTAGRGTVKSAGMPYKIGFQPQGVRGDRTGEYVDARRERGEEREREEGRLGRRWAKLVDLHFNPTIPPPPPQTTIPSLTRSSSSTFSLSTLSDPDRRRSLLSLDGALDALKPKEILKGLKGPVKPGGEEGRKRTAEQAIVKWEDDHEVKKCRICQSSFSLSNRKHHCRLCGRIVCSLQPTPSALLAVQIQLFAPSDPAATSTATQAGLPPGTRRDKCSLLLVADWKTGRGEEVEEGFVGWMKMDEPDAPSQSPSPSDSNSSPARGALRGPDDADRGKKRRARTSTASIMSTNSVGSDGGASASAVEKRDIPLPQQPKEVQVKGVRVCRECWAVVSRKQKMQDRQRVTGFAKLYQALRGLQVEIEEVMPEYEEQLAELTESEKPLDPSSETLQTHKTLLTLFAQYEHLSKRIGGLPCEEGGSQALVQSAVARSAAGFLAKEMVKLQALQRLQKKAALAKRKSMAVRQLTLSDTMTTASSDGDALEAGQEQQQEMEDVAVMLQPLLEQEAQLESYIADANAQRKYEDSKALSEALREIRSEIERISTGAK